MSPRRSMGSRRMYTGWRVASFLDASHTGQAMVDALMVPCPACNRTAGNACVLPAGTEHQGIFLHHERIALGGKSR